MCHGAVDGPLIFSHQISDDERGASRDARTAMHLEGFNRHFCHKVFFCEYPMMSAVQCCTFSFLNVR